MLFPTLIISAMMLNASTYESINSVDLCISVEVQGVVIRQNAHLKCNEVESELYLYTNGKFKLINRDDALIGTYTIEDGENIALNADGYRTTYGKIYFKGSVVSRVVLGERTYFPVYQYK